MLFRIFRVNSSLSDSVQEALAVGSVAELDDIKTGVSEDAAVHTGRKTGSVYITLRQTEGHGNALRRGGGIALAIREGAVRLLEGAELFDRVIYHLGKILAYR